MLGTMFRRTPGVGMRMMPRPSLIAPLQMSYIGIRPFGHTKYSFDDEDWKPNQFQVSSITASVLTILLTFR